MRNGNEEGIIMGDKIQQEIPGFSNQLDLNIESAFLVDIWLHFKYRLEGYQVEQSCLQNSFDSGIMK